MLTYNFLAQLSHHKNNNKHPDEDYVAFSFPNFSPVPLIGEDIDILNDSIYIA